MWKSGGRKKTESKSKIGRAARERAENRLQKPEEKRNSAKNDFFSKKTKSRNQRSEPGFSRKGQKGTAKKTAKKKRKNAQKKKGLKTERKGTKTQKEGVQTAMQQKQQTICKRKNIRWLLVLSSRSRADLSSGVKIKKSKTRGEKGERGGRGKGAFHQIPGVIITWEKVGIDPKSPKLESRCGDL